jgi:hypothetical protein
MPSRGARLAALCFESGWPAAEEKSGKAPGGVHGLPNSCQQVSRLSSKAQRIRTSSYFPHQFTSFLIAREDTNRLDAYAEEKPLHDELTKLLTDLKIAIHHSLADDNVAAALAALEKAGHVVNVALDVTLVSGQSERYPRPECFTSGREGNLELSPSDALFLRLLRIAS